MQRTIKVKLKRVNVNIPSKSKTSYWQQEVKVRFPPNSKGVGYPVNVFYDRYLDYKSSGTDIIDNILFVSVIVSLKSKIEKQVYLENENISIYKEVAEQLIGEVLENEKQR